MTHVRLRRDWLHRSVTQGHGLHCRETTLLPVEICGHFCPTVEAGDISYDPALCARHPFGQ